MNRRSFLKTVVAGAVALSTVAAPGSFASAQGKDIVDTAVGAGTFKTLAAALTAAGLVDTLRGTGPFTLFAPTDEAFAKRPAGTVETFLKPENKDQLIAILTYHVVPGAVKAADVVKLKSATTVQGEDIAIKAEGGSKVMVNGANVTATDITASNGVIHVIDSVILPPSVEKAMMATPADAMTAKDIVDTAVGAGSFKTLAAAVTAAGLVDTLKGAGPFTVFAPTDDAFAKLPAGTVDTLLKPENKQQLVDILTYHVVSGAVKAADVVKLTEAATVNGAPVKITVADGKVKVNDANVTATDITASNGVIHVIDSVILPPAKPVNIVDTAVAAGNFTTLAAALQAAGLVNTLKGGRWTVFAPTDEAFAKLPAGTVEDLLKPENRNTLRDILLYHVARGRLDAAQVTKHSGITMANGVRTLINIADGVKINDANITATDIAATNGIIHVIDTVILPPGNIAAVAQGAGSFATLLAAVQAAGLERDLTGRGPLTVLAPTDEAFAKLPEGTLDDLLKPENLNTLRTILRNHIVRGYNGSSAVSKLKAVRTLAGKSLPVSVTDGKVMIGDATVTTADVLARNGIIHVIDTVLVP